MSSEYQRKQSYIRGIEEIFKNPHNMAEELKIWAMCVMDEPPFILSGIKHKQLLENLNSFLCAELDKVKNVPPLELIEFFCETYCSDGPFADHHFSMNIDKSSSTQLLGALYFLAAAEFTGVRDDLRMRAVKVTAEIAFEGKKKWGALSAVLQEIDQANPGYDLLAGIPDMLVNLEKHMVSESDVVFMQKAGGIERIKAVGADPEKVYTSAMQSISTTTLNNAGLPVIHQFAKEVLEDLKASGRITQAQAGERYGQLLEGVFIALNRSRNFNQDCWKPLLNDLAPYVNKDSGTDLILHMARVNGPDQLGLSLETVRSMVEPEAFKNGLSKWVDKGEQLELLKALGIDDLFSEVDINKMKGAKLESALGL
jgi:hypothetical protein